MGEVFRARDTKLDRDVAIKVLPSDLAEDAIASPASSARLSSSPPSIIPTSPTSTASKPQSLRPAQGPASLVEASKRPSASSPWSCRLGSFPTRATLQRGLSSQRSRRYPPGLHFGWLDT